ncbi:MAG: DUF3786 domain-containing protein [Chloroflexota bacterium]|nr:MAG: DUF3786 domain-containing protein [Chloroflexota bacterium]
MKNRQDSSGGSREQGFELSYRLAAKQLSQISDIEAQCHKSGAQYIGTNKIVIDYLSQSYHITIPDAQISLKNSQIEVPLKAKILILHYFTSAKGTPPTGILINFKQLPGGLSYFPAFSQRTINPFVKHFGQKPELLIDISAKLGGYKTEQGDISATIDAFNHVPITFALWRGDEEFSPSGAVLFDANISDYLPTEDVTVLCETIVWKLVKSIPPT